MNSKFYTAFGILTAAFSRMEADVRMLISGIAFSGNSVIASAFIDTSQLSENLTVLRKLSRQYWDKEAIFMDIVKLIESIRETRNLFIHGIWQPGNFNEQNGFATVTDLKTKYEKEKTKRTWVHSQTLQFSISDFQNILNSTNSASGKIRKLCELLEMENNDMQFGQGGLTASSEPVLIPIPKYDESENEE